MENFTRTISTDKESTYGQTVEYTAENGSTIKWKAKVFSLGAMVVDTWVNTRMIRNMGKVLLNGQMVGNI